MAVSSGEVDGSALVSGDEVFLNEEQNVLVGISPERAGRAGETVLFERLTTDGRIVVKSRDEEILVDAGGRLDCDALTKGDVLLWDRKAWLALEQVPHSIETGVFDRADTIRSLRGYRGVGVTDRRRATFDSSATSIIKTSCVYTDCADADRCSSSERRVQGRR